MLNREEYNMTFGCELSEEEFETIMGKSITDEDILNGRVDRLTFCDKQGHKQEFARVVRGEWQTCDAPPPTWWYECSVCGSEGNKSYNFCPWCGADMRGDKK